MTGLIHIEQNAGEGKLRRHLYGYFSEQRGRYICGSIRGVPDSP